jgi:GNAT superfamily N-acetyltransferase
VLEVRPVIDRLPAGFNDMRAEASAEGYLFVDGLSKDWEADAMRFDRDGEELLAAHMNGVLAAIGGLTLDPVVPGALRMRRFYVRPSFRRHGIGRSLVEGLLEHPRRTGRVVMVNAARGSSAFWEALGFMPDLRDGYTHVLQLPSPATT